MPAHGPHESPHGNRPSPSGSHTPGSCTAPHEGEARARSFAHPARDFAQTAEALRLRSVGDEVAITWKGPRLADGSAEPRSYLQMLLERTSRQA